MFKALTGFLTVIMVLAVGGYAMWNYGAVRSGIEDIQKEWKRKNIDQLIEDKINNLKDEVDSKKNKVVDLMVKKRSVERLLGEENERFNRYDTVIKGLVDQIEKAKKGEINAPFDYCGKEYTVASAEKTFNQWTEEILPLKKRIGYLEKQQEMYGTAIANINQSIESMKNGIVGLEQKALELTTIRDTLEAQKMAKDLIAGASGFDDSEVNALLRELQEDVDEIEIRVNMDMESPTSSSLAESVNYKEETVVNSELNQLRQQYLKQTENN